MTTTKGNKSTLPTVMLVGALRRIERKTNRQVRHCATVIWEELVWRVEQAKKEVGL